MHWKATNKLSLLLISLVAVEVTGVSSNVWGYESDLHQQLTFIAARQLNECVQDEANVARLSALDTRYIVKANVALRGLRREIGRDVVDSQCHDGLL